MERKTKKTPQEIAAILFIIIVVIVALELVGSALDGARSDVQARDCQLNPGNC